MSSLSQSQKSLLADVVDALRSLGNVLGVVLGGSHARGRARADSDIDLGIYYREDAPFSLETLRGIAAKLNDAADPVVSDFYEWGPWVNGGAWLTVRGQRVDLLYRGVEKCEAVIGDAHHGRYEIHYPQQPPFGFFSPIYLGELHEAVPLLDSQGEVARLKSEVAEYPDALRRAVVQNCLWGVEFGLTAFAPKFAKANDAYNVAACIARFSYFLILTLFALNRRYFVNDKTALAEVTEFELAPSEVADRINALLGNVGRTPEALSASLNTTRALFEETASIAGPLYRSNRAP